MTTFDKQLARLLLEICRYTYAASFRNFDDQDDAFNWINQQEEKPSSPYLVNDGRILSTSVACVFSYPDKNIVAYMGTKTNFSTVGNSVGSIKDWYKNIRAQQVPFRLTTSQLGTEQDVELEGNVHEGFLTELKAVQAEVVRILLQNGGKERPLYVTGHSQGGAEATLATKAFLAGGFKVIATYTFAAPRSGDKIFAASIPPDYPFHRIEFGDDIVPHVPPALLSKAAPKITSSFLGPFLPGYIRDLLDVLSDDWVYAGVGALCYGSHRTQKLEIGLSAKQETDLFKERIVNLIRNPKNWSRHHRLAGTKEETQAGRKGNYTALVSEYD